MSTGSTTAPSSTTFASLLDTTGAQDQKVTAEEQQLQLDQALDASDHAQLVSAFQAYGVPFIGHIETDGFTLSIYSLDATGKLVKQAGILSTAPTPAPPPAATSQGANAPTSAPSG